MARGDGHDATTPGGCLFVVLQLCLIRISAFPQFPRLLQADDDRRQSEEADIGGRNDERDQRGHYAGAVECSDTDILADDDLADAELRVGEEAEQNEHVVDGWSTRTGLRRCQRAR
jgi:hypothetical protein